MLNISEALEKIDFFKCLPPEVLSDIIDKFVRIEFKAGEVVYLENTLADCLYVLVSGKVVLFKKLPSFLLYSGISNKVIYNRDFVVTDAEIIDEVEPYNLFGEVALIENCNRKIGCIAKTDSILLTLTKEIFLDLCMKNPESIIHIVRKNFQRIDLIDQKFYLSVDKLLKAKGLWDIGKSVSKIIHDINTPISVIILQAELISRIFPDAQEFTNKIYKHANNIDEMVREILDYTKGKQSFLDINPHKVCDLLASVEDTIKPIADIKNIHLIFNNDYQEYVNIDLKKIERTLLNILKNAVQASPEDCRIEVTSFKKDRFWHLIIKDQGPGIQLELIDDLFTPFITIGKDSGTGLGLAICKKCVEDHKGKITVQNHENGGAVFEIMIPVG